MARTTYQVILSTDGTHKLTASTDDPAELQSAMDSLKNAYKWMEYFIQQGELHTPKSQGEEAPQLLASGHSVGALLCCAHTGPEGWQAQGGMFQALLSLRSGRSKQRRYPRIRQAALRLNG